jgi:hypothetical protein
LCNNDTRKNLSDSLPDYIKIANKLCIQKSNEFCNAIRKSSFGEVEFKRRLCLCRKHKSRDIRQLIELYCVFGTVTVELFDMMEQIEDILRFLARSDAVSLLEVHQKLSLINNVSDDDDKGRHSSENIIFDLLSSFGCFHKSLSVVFEECFFTMTNIDEEFEKKNVRS